MTPGERARSAVIFFLSEDLRRAKYLHDLHEPDMRGHCLGCHTQMAPTPWPCILRQLADDTVARAIPLQRRASR